MSSNQVQLNTLSLLKVPIETYEKDFTFIVNGSEFKTSRLVSDLLSTTISRNHINDPTLNTFYINTKHSGDFSQILQLTEFTPLSIDDEELPFFLEVIEILKPPSIEMEMKETKEKLNIDNVFTHLEYHNKYQSFQLTPDSENILHVELFDMDKVSDDDLISNRDFDIKSFKPGEVYDNWYEFFPSPKAKDNPGKVHLIFHVANADEIPFVPRPQEEAVVQEKEVKVEQEPEEEQEPEQEPDQQPEPEQKEPEQEQQPEPEPEPEQQQPEPEPEPESKQNEEDNQPQILNEIDTNNVQTREINPILEQPPQNQQEEEKPVQQEETKTETKEAAPIEKIQAQTRSTLQSNQAKGYKEDLDELPFDESKCKMILLVVILVELFILFLMKKF